MADIRFAVNGDMNGIMDLYRILIPGDTPENPGKLADIWKYIMENQDRYRYIVAEENGMILSTCNITIIPNLTRSGRSYAVIENVVTHPDARRKGLGHKTIEMALDFAKSRGCYKIMLLSGSQRAEAHRFYESLGFSGTRKRGFVIEHLE